MVSQELRDRYRELVELGDEPEGNIARKRGFDFERLLYELLESEGLEPRRPYKAHGEQIDGSFLLDGRVYLLEAKWFRSALPASSLYSFKGKVEGKLTGTVGIFISMSGYSDEASDALALGKEMNVILCDRADLDEVFASRLQFAQLIRRKLRAASEEGIVYLPAGGPSVKAGQGKTSPTTIGAIALTLPLGGEAVTVSAEFEKAVIVEGRRDASVCEVLAGRVLRQHPDVVDVAFLPAGGKLALPSLGLLATEMLPGKHRVALVADSDDDPATADVLRGRLGVQRNVALVIADPNLESDWLGVEPDWVATTRRRARHADEELIARAREIDIEQLEQRSSSFRAFAEFLRAPTIRSEDDQSEPVG